MSAEEVVRLHERLAGRLEAMSLDTQPEVAARILQMSQSDPGVRDFAEVIRDDPALSARLIKIANSALYAQRDPVTTVERACLILGTRHLRSASLSFCLARDDEGSEMSRVASAVWLMSLYRALLASELAREVAPELAAEAFLVGLVLDSGVVAMHRLLGAEYLTMGTYWEEPAKHFREENRRLEFGHVDVISVLVKRWRFPDLLARPISMHHVRPVAYSRDPVEMMHRLAYAVGQVPGTSEGSPRSAAESEAQARLMFPGVSREVLRGAVERSLARHEEVTGEYASLRVGLGDADGLARYVQRRFQLSIDEVMVDSLSRPEAARAVSLTIGGSRVEVEAQRTGELVVYLTDSLGDRIASHHVDRARDTGASIADALGITPGDEESTELLDALIRTQAA